jgi:hypothetical protein
MKIFNNFLGGRQNNLIGQNDIGSNTLISRGSISGTILLWLVPHLHISKHSEAMEGRIRQWPIVVSQWIDRCQRRR